MASSNTDSAQPQFQMKWLDMMHIRMASLKHRLKPPTEYANTIDDYDLSDVSLEETLAKSSKTTELLYLVRGQTIGVTGATGRTVDKVIVSQTEIPLSDTAFYDDNVAGCLGAIVPAWRCRDVYDLTEEDLVTVIASQIRPAIYTYVPKPKLTPPSAARQKQHTVDCCFELRRGDYVRTVDGIERQIVTNDCQLMLLFDTSVVAFTYYKVQKAKTRQNRAVSADVLAWWGRQMNIVEPVSPSKVGTDLLQANWDRSGRSSSAQFPNAPLPSSTKVTSTFPPLRKHGRPGEYARQRQSVGLAPAASDTSKGPPVIAAKTPRSDADNDTGKPANPQDPRPPSGGTGDGGNDGGDDDDGGSGRKEDDPDLEDSAADEDEEDSEESDAEQQHEGNPAVGTDTHGSPVFSSPLKGRKGPLISLPDSTANASPPLLAFPQDDNNGRLVSPIQPTVAPSDRTTPPPPPPAVSHMCKCKCSAPTISDHAAERISQQIANMGTHMKCHFDETYGSLLRRIAAGPRTDVASTQTVNITGTASTQTFTVRQSKAVQASVKQHSRPVQTTVSGNIAMGAPAAAVPASSAAQKRPTKPNTAEPPMKKAKNADKGNKQTDRDGEESKEKELKETKKDQKKPARSGAKGATGGSATDGGAAGGGAVLRPVDTPIVQLRLPPVKYSVLSQSGLGVRRWGTSLPTEYVFDGDYVVVRERHVLAASAAAGPVPPAGAEEAVWARHCKKFCSSVIAAVCEHDGKTPAVFFPKPNPAKTGNVDELIERQPAPIGIALRKYVSTFGDGGAGAALGGIRMYVDGQRLVYEEALKQLEGCVKPKKLLDYWR